VAVESLFWICLAGVIAPVVAGLVPHKLVPEVVILLILGIVIGPFALELAQVDEAIDLLHELGLAMLFLLAGFEIEREELTGREGRVAGVTWLASLGIGFLVIGLLGVTDVIDEQVAVAIALTSTALGTLLPILKDNGLMRSPVGARVLRHGAYGELGPILAMALLLSARGALASAVVLIAFGAIACVFAVQSVRLRRSTSRVLDLVRAGAYTTGQTPVRITLLLLVTLMAVASVFELDIVLAAFAAGFILRLAIPEGNDMLESRLEGIAFGFLVPIFFVTSGMAVDPAAITENLPAFAAIIVMILLCRGVPVLLATRFLEPDRPSLRDSMAVALFSATGLPIIVAVTTVAVRAELMSAENASLLVGAGAATVLVCPLLASLFIDRTPAPQR
jgi:Kef-type K+ transport system membrane component KefB